MAQFCTCCGKPLPITGICPCGKNIPNSSPPYPSPSDNMWESTPPAPQRDTELYETPPKAESNVENLPEEFEEEFYEEDFNESETAPPPTKARDSFGVRQTISQLFNTLISYCKDPLGTCHALAQEPRLRSSLSLVVITFCLSAIGTLALGIMHLEDFFFRWFCVGFVAPAAAFGGSLLFALLLTHLEQRALLQESINIPPKPNLSVLLSTIAASSIFPILLLAASALLSLIDDSLQLFQFFALLILITWVLSLILSLFSVCRIHFRPLTLFLSIGFLFLALVTMRPLWVWFLTGEFQFALYLPLGLFFGGF